MSRFRWLPADSPFDEMLFRRLFERIKRPLPSDPEIVTAYTDGQVTLRSNRSREGYHEAADLSGFQGVEVGDFVVHGLDILRGSVGVADSAGALSSVCTVCVPRLELDLRFFAYAMRAQAWAGVPRALAKGVREGGADFRRWDTLADLPLPVPSLAEQTVIADYLDIETARLDRVVQERSRLISLLKERLLSTITATLFEHCRETSTEVGEQGSVSRIESVSWRSLKYLCSEPAQYGLNIAASEYVAETSGAIRLIRTTDIEEHGSISADNGVFLDSRKVPMSRRLLSGDLLLSRSGTIGRTLLYPEAAPSATFAGYLVRFRPKSDVDARYLAYCIRSSPIQHAILSDAVNSTIANFNAERYANLALPWRPLSEQRVIADYLDVESTRSKLLIEKLLDEIELLVERRRALITAAVTGDLDVPEVAP